MFHHGPNQQSGPDHAEGFKTRLGLWMFLLYGIVYVIFVWINVQRPALMGRTVFMGLNLAITYGVGLIIFALFLAVIYNHLCNRKEAELNIIVSSEGEDH